MVKYKILFDAYHLYHLPQFDPVIDLLLEDSRFEVKVTTSPDNMAEEIDLTLDVFNSRNFNILFIRNRQKLNEMIAEFNPDIYICGWSRYPLDQIVPKRALVGMIYHGIGVKPSYWRDNHSRIDLRFIEGPYRKKQLIDKGITTDLALTGFSKLDPVFNGHLPSREEILTDLGLDPSKKTILFAPTFYPSSFEAYGEKLLEYTKEYNLIIKMHMWVYFMEKFGGVNLKKQKILVEKLRHKSDHVAIIDPHRYNITPLYAASDVLLTEASSTIFEMMAVGKPVIVASFYKLYLSHRLFRSRLYRKRLDANMTKDISRFCTVIDRPKQLKSALRNIFESEYKPLKDQKEYIFNWLYNLDGKVSERIVEAILNRLKNRTIVPE